MKNPVSLRPLSSSKRRAMIFWVVFPAVIIGVLWGMSLYLFVSRDASAVKNVTGSIINSAFFHWGSAQETTDKLEEDARRRLQNK